MKLTINIFFPLFFASQLVFSQSLQRNDSIVCTTIYKLEFLMGKLEEVNVLKERIDIKDSINNRLKKRIAIKDSTIIIYENLDSLNRNIINNHHLIQNIKNIQITSLVDKLNESATINKKLKIFIVALGILGIILAL